MLSGVVSQTAVYDQDTREVTMSVTGPMFATKYDVNTVRFFNQQFGCNRRESGQLVDRCVAHNRAITTVELFPVI